MKKVRLYFLSLFLLFGCSEHLLLINCDGLDFECSSDFCYDFQDALIKIQLSEQEYPIALYQKRKAVEYLSKVTGIKSQVNSYEIPVYDDKEKLKEDVINWIKWYEDNKCSFTKLKADSIAN